MRIDRLLTLRVVAPVLDVLGRSRTETLPILMYHGISNRTDDRSHPYYRTVTTPKAFELQMRLLHDAGYRGVALSEALGNGVGPTLTCEALGGHARNTVVITFDDGLRDVFTAAFPIMRSFGFSATVYLSTECIGRDFINGSPCLGEREIRYLAGEGIEFGSHTVTHPQLRSLPRGAIARELLDSKSRIEDILGNSVHTFSYPFRFPEEDAEFIVDLKEMLEHAGYRSGVTTSIGCSRAGDSLLFLKRLPINDCDDPPLFRAKLAGAYDWLHGAQLTLKKLRALYAR